MSIVNVFIDARTQEEIEELPLHVELGITRSSLVYDQVLVDPDTVEERLTFKHYLWLPEEVEDDGDAE